MDCLLGKVLLIKFGLAKNCAEQSNSFVCVTYNMYNFNHNNLYVKCTSLNPVNFIGLHDFVQTLPPCLTSELQNNLDSYCDIKKLISFST